jgi:hypothetical protein
MLKFRDLHIFSAIQKVRELGHHQRDLHIFSAICELEN